MPLHNDCLLDYADAEEKLVITVDYHQDEVGKKKVTKKPVNLLLA